MDARRFFVDDASPLPVYVQLSEQVLAAMARGEIGTGEQLPSVRDVAAALHLNPNTVNRAYAELERIGVVETRRGRGTFACQPRGRRQAAVPRLVDVAEPFVARALALGYAGRQIVKTVADVVRRTS